MNPSTIPSPNLLCEMCGYSLEGLPGTGACPECGRPIEQSHPDHRIGSVWQRSPGPVTGLKASATTLLRPRRGWDTIMVEREASSALLWIHCTLAAALFPGIGLVVVSGQTAALSLSLMLTVVWIAALLALSWIESAGIRSLGRLRKRRINADVAYAIVGHASVGWVVGACFGLITSVVVSQKTDVDWRLQGIGVAAAVSVGAGLIVFELLTWLGVRRMKYANAPRRQTIPSPSRTGRGLG